MEASTPRHEGRPPAADLPLPSGGRGLHPPGPPPACSPPHSMGKGGKGILYLQPCKKKCHTPLRGLSGPRLGEAMPSRGLHTGPAEHPCCPDFIAKGCRITVARFILPAEAAVAATGGEVGEPLGTSPDPLAHAGAVRGGRVACRSGAGLTALGVLTSPSPSAGTTTSSRRQQAAKIDFRRG